MSGQMCNWRLVQPSSSIYVNGIDSFFSTLGAVCCGLTLELTRRGKEEAAIRSKSEPPKEGCIRFVCVDASIPYPSASSQIEIWVR